jgi:hypothetical protein
MQAAALWWADPSSEEAYKVYVSFMTSELI